MIIACDKNGRAVRQADALVVPPGVFVAHLGAGRVRIGGRGTAAFVTGEKTTTKDVTGATVWRSRTVTKDAGGGTASRWRTKDASKVFTKFIPSHGTITVTHVFWTASKPVTRYVTAVTRVVTNMSDITIATMTHTATVTRAFTVTVTRELTRTVTRDFTHVLTAVSE